MCDIHVRHIAEIVVVSGKVLGCLGGFVDSGGRRDPGALRGSGSQSTVMDDRWRREMISDDRLV